MVTASCSSVAGSFFSIISLRSAKSKWGGNEAAGELHLVFEFVGPPGVAYPQHQPTMDSFDDSQRKNRASVERDAKEKQDREDAAEAARKAAEDVGGILDFVDIAGAT